MSEEQRNVHGPMFTNKVEGFESPTMLPRDDAQHSQWQQANKTWWESTPMRYDWRDGVPFEKHSKEYFEEIDRRFLASVKAYLPWRSLPFEQLIPYARLPELDVLEIGVGQGTHAQLIAPHCRSFTGIDLTEAASEAVAARLEQNGIQAIIQQMDAEAMSFSDASFDYIWSWGVIHHSADTSRVLRQMHRVLRPGGRTTVMVYHRNWWNFIVVAGLLKGIVQGQFRELQDLHHIAQGATDGAIARYYRPDEWQTLNKGMFEIEDMRVYGLKSELIPLPAGALKRALESGLPNWLTRFGTNTMRMGGFLVADMRRV